MARKHNTKHQRGTSSYGDKVRQHGAQRLTDVRLSDGKPASAER
jgi:hypothetical protein